MADRKGGQARAVLDFSIFRILLWLQVCARTEACGRGGWRRWGEWLTDESQMQLAALEEAKVLPPPRLSAPWLSGSFRSPSQPPGQ